MSDEDRIQDHTKNEPKGLFHRVGYFLFHLSLAVMMQSMVVSGYLNSINTTIERRYKLTTKEVGYIYMAYELACIPTTIIFSLIGHRLNRARVIGGAGIIMTIGFVLFTLPHFIGSNYNLDICHRNSTTALCNVKIGKKISCRETISDSWALFIFCFAQVLIGVGSSPIYVLGPAYLWDNLSSKKYSIYSCRFINSLLCHSFVCVY